MDLAFNNLQLWMCHKNQPNQTKTLLIYPSVIFLKRYKKKTKGKKKKKKRNC